MSSISQPVDFDSRPPVPVSEYARTVIAVNTGYEQVFTLTHCFLRALKKPDLNLLAVGAGGGAEIERFLPENPGWRLVGVDPSRDMLAEARATAERLGLQDRVELVQGTVADLPAERHFDAATCHYVLHFLPDDAKLALLRGIAGRLQPGAPLLTASGARIDESAMRQEDGALRDLFLGAWQQHGELMGIPVPQMAAIIEQLLTQQAQATDANGYMRLLREAGFSAVAPFFTVMNGGMGAWIAR